MTPEERHAAVLDDLAEDRRLDELERTAGRAVPRGKTPAKVATAEANPPHRIYHAHELIDEPRPVEIVEGIAYARHLTVLVSESGVGKTFVELSLEAAISAGLPWHGRATRAGSVLHLSFEGDALGVRLRALRDVTGHRLEHVYIIRPTDPISPLMTREGGELPSVGELAIRDDLTSLAASLVTRDHPPLVLVTVDTVRQSLAGSEDNSEHVAAYLRAVRRLMTLTPEAGWILAHHAGWQDGEQKRKRERGSSAFRGNCDTTLYLECEGYDAATGTARLLLRALKTRDSECPAPLHLIRRRVELPEAMSDDLRRGPVTSCVIDADRRTRQDREAEQVHAAEVNSLAVDRRVLAAMHQSRAASVRALREFAGLKYDAVADAVSRLLRRGWVTKDRQRDPYVLTEPGRLALQEAPCE